ncbi:ABC transporter permease [Candidatus Enterovibrio escicola]|uniref:ABC transporter permease n=1 Tax=Candidatus Enterovibrio escicola TaxID=1927127 RepID=UPI00123820F8|nr:ABC transporter permease [Candidatus Enterovibrio escacola]
MLLPIKQIFQEMVAEKLPLGLTILAVAWATLCIAGMLSVGEGIRQGILRTIQNGNGNLIYLTGGMATVDNDVFHHGKWLKLKVDDPAALIALPGVILALPTVQWDEYLSVEDRIIWRKPLAVTLGFNLMTGLKLLPKSRWFNPLDEKEMRKVIVLGYETASKLFNPEEDVSWFNPINLKTDPVGKVVKIGSEEFTVVGVLAENSSWIEESDQINSASFVPMATWKRFYPNGDIGAINIQPEAGIDRIKLAKMLRQVIARKHGADVTDKQVVQIQDMFLEQKSTQKFLIGLQSFLSIIGFITLAVAGLGIANIMYATVKRSTRDIGVRMAVGATPMAIRLHYLVQTMMTTMLGGVLGLTVTYGLVTLIRSVNLGGSGFYQTLGKPVPEISFIVVVVVIVTLMVIGVVAAWLPANRAARITPLEALQSA